MRALSEDWLSARTRASPDATALIIGEDQWTYQQLNKLVGRATASVHTYTKINERVACLLPNNLMFVCLVHALARAGALLVPINSRLTEEEITWQLRKARCSLLFFDDDTALLASSLDMDLLLVHASELLSPQSSMAKTTVPSFAIQNEQGIVFTSGTSGTPKGAVLSYSNYFYSAISSAFRIGVSPEDRWLCCLPLYHVGGLAILFRSCLYGTTVALHNGFDVAAVSSALETGGITLISLVPTMLHRLMQYRDGQIWPSAVRLVLLGGAAPSPELIAKCHSLGIPVSTTYGLTEAASQVATMLPEDVRRKPGSVGKPLMFTRIAIRSGDGRILPAGEVGEITVAGPTVMSGYDGDELNSAAALRDGWLFTGDAGYLDEDGDLWIIQRRSDIIISGGENVYPAEVEAVVRRHPLVEEVCVIGIADEEWGQRVAAAVVASGKKAPSTADILSFCRTHLAGYKLPRSILFVPSLPKTASGKIERRKVADLLSSLTET